MPHPWDVYAAVSPDELLRYRGSAGREAPHDRSGAAGVFLDSGFFGTSPQMDPDEEAGSDATTKERSGDAVQGPASASDQSPPAAPNA